MHTALRVLVIVALLYGQVPCGTAFGSPAPCCQPEQPEAAHPPCCCCGCCDDVPATSATAVVQSADDRAPCTPTGCPANCPCAVCSAGYVPLSHFIAVSLPVDAAFGPPLLTADLSRGHAGHHQLPDRPPRVG